MADDNLDEWQDVLAGRRSAAATNAAVRLRKILLQEDRRLDENIRANHPSDELALEELRFRVRQAQFRRKSPVRKYGIPLACAASILIAGMLLQRMWREATVDTGEKVSEVSAGHALRQEPGAVRVVEARLANPLAAAEAMQNELSKAGVSSTIERVADGYALDFTFESGRQLTVGSTLINGGIVVKPGHSRVHIAASH